MTLSVEERAKVLVEALPYIKRFYGQTVVIKDRAAVALEGFASSFVFQVKHIQHLLVSRSCPPPVSGVIAPIVGDVGTGDVGIAVFPIARGQDPARGTQAAPLLAPTERYSS